MKLKTSWHFTKWDGLNIVLVIHYITCPKNFTALQIFLNIFLLKWKKKMKEILSSVYSFKLKNIISFLNQGLIFIFFSNGHIHNVVKIYVENGVVSTLPNVVQINVVQFDVVQRCKFQRWRTQRDFNVDLTLCDVAMSYQPKNNVETTLKCLLGHDPSRGAYRVP